MSCCFSLYAVQERTSLKDHGRRHSDPNLSAAIPPGGEANDVVSMESMKSSDVEFETGSLHDEIGNMCNVCTYYRMYVVTICLRVICYVVCSIEITNCVVFHTRRGIMWV